MRAFRSGPVRVDDNRTRVVPIQSFKCDLVWYLSFSERDVIS